MPAQCWECHDYGHVAADCPSKLYASEIGDGKPAWCGQCDRETRLVYFRRDGTDAARRCTSCHPNSTVLPAQFGKCRGCGHAIYDWDRRSECGKHQPIGKQLRVKPTEKARKAA